MTTLTESLPEPDNDARIAQRLRMYMGDVKLSRSRLALATGMKRSTLSNKLDGLSPITIDDVVAIARAIQGNWLWVVTGEGQPPPPHFMPRGLGNRSSGGSGADFSRTVTDWLPVYFPGAA